VRLASVDDEDWPFVASPAFNNITAGHLKLDKEKNAKMAW